MRIGILMGLSTKWIGLHHVDQGGLQLEGGIPEVDIRALSYVGS